jgi:hypothetical protein
VQLYCGLFDDFAARNGDGRTVTTVAGLNHLLLTSALFGDSLLINDGYVLQNAALKAAILETKASPLESLIRCGFVRILTRNDRNLGALAEYMADRDISAAQDLLRSEDFATTYQPRLREWSEDLPDTAFAWWPKPKSLRTNLVLASVSQTAVERLESRTGEDAMIASFVEELGDQLGSRTAWENIARRLRETERISNGLFQTLMRTANEAYQYSWGCILTSFPEPCGVQMRLPTLLSDLDLPVGDAATTERSPLRFRIADETFANRAVKKRWKLLAAVATSGTGINGEKERFRREVTRYYTSNEMTDETFAREAKRYGRALSKHFASTGITGVGLDVGIAAAGIAIPATLLTGGAALGVGAAIAVGGIATSHLNVAGNLLWSLRAPKPSRWMKRIREPDPQDAVSSFQVDPEAARVHLEKARP